MALNIVQSYGGVSRMNDIGSAFAADLSKRISSLRGLDVPRATDEQEISREQSDKLSQLQKLESALSRTVSYMSERHGAQAASAMIGLIYKRLGDGEINEQTLGNAFLDVTRFIDSQFGVARGDEFMDHLNGSLNNSMNEFFDNGMSEQFIDASKFHTGSGGGGVEGIMSQLIEGYTDAVKTILEEARQAAHERQNSPFAAYAAPQEQGFMQGVLTDIMV